MLARCSIRTPPTPKEADPRPTLASCWRVTTCFWHKTTPPATTSNINNHLRKPIFLTLGRVAQLICPAIHLRLMFTILPCLVLSPPMILCLSFQLKAFLMTVIRQYLFKTPSIFISDIAPFPFVAPDTVFE